MVTVDGLAAPGGWVTGGTDSTPATRGQRGMVFRGALRGESPRTREGRRPDRTTAGVRGEGSGIRGDGACAVWGRESDLALLLAELYESLPPIWSARRAKLRLWPKKGKVYNYSSTVSCRPRRVFAKRALQESNRPNPVALCDPGPRLKIEKHVKYSNFGTDTRPFCPFDGSPQPAGRSLGGDRTGLGG